VREEKESEENSSEEECDCFEECDCDPCECDECKKCKGRGAHRRGEMCGTCAGSGRVTVIVDESGAKIIKPAVRK
jgi:hypothetical protein